LFVRFCDKIIINVLGGSEPNYFPASMLWQGATTTPVCSEPWLKHHRQAGETLVSQGLADEGRVLLEGVQHGCESGAPAEWRAIQDDIDRIDQRSRSATPTGYDFSWIKEFAKTEPNAQVVLDPRFSNLLVATLPDAKLGDDSLRAALKKSVWLPDDTKVIDDRYVIISGCEPHNCLNRGMLWIDTASQQAIAVTGGTLASRSTEPDKIPDVFWKHARDRFGQLADETVDFIDRSGKTIKVRVP
jgi:hypothetical protein